MGRKLRILFSIPRTIWFNLRYLPLSQAIKLPVWIAPNVRIKELHRGGMKLKYARFNSTHIGFHVADAVDCYGVHTIICVRRGGVWNLDTAHIGQGAVIHVNEAGVLTTGSHFAISGTTSIVCSNSIVIGDNVQFSWNSLVMDSDAHKIFDVDGKLMNLIGEVEIGNKVWIAANITIMKNSKIGDGCVVAANSLVNKKFKESNVILAGSPVREVKKIGGWEL